MTVIRVVISGIAHRRSAPPHLPLLEWVDRIGGSGKLGAIATTLSPPGSLLIILLYKKLYHRHEQRCRSELEELFHDDVHPQTNWSAGEEELARAGDERRGRTCRRMGGMGGYGAYGRRGYFQEERMGGDGEGNAPTRRRGLRRWGRRKPKHFRGDVQKDSSESKPALDDLATNAFVFSPRSI